MTDPIQRFNPPHLFDSLQIGYSQISIAKPGRLAFFSGQVAWTPESMTAPPSLAEQARLVFRSISDSLTALGATPDDIVSMRVYIVDLTPERTEAVLPALVEMLGDTHPSITGIGVQALWTPDLQIEVEVLVRVPE